MWGEIISAGAGLIGSLFGKKKSQSTSTTVDYGRMVKDASAAGFNPLTAIRNGGSAGFTTTTSPTVSAMPEVLSNLGGALGSALDKKLDPIEAKKREVDSALLDYQLKQFKQGPDIPGRFYPAREYTGTKVSQQNVPRLGAKSHQQVAATPSTKVADFLDEQKPTHTNPWGWTNGWIEPAPDRVDAAAYEDAYGDGLGMVVGNLVPFGQDWRHNVHRGVGYLDKNYLKPFEDGIKNRLKEMREKETNPHPYRWVGPRIKRSVSDFFGWSSGPRTGGGF